MTEYQQVIFTFIDEKDRQLGDLKLRTPYHGPKQGDIQDEYIKCENVPQLSLPTDKFPIEYCKFNALHGLSKIMLIEETQYDIYFKAANKKDVTSFLPELKDIFTRHLFNEKISQRVGILNFGSYVGRTYLSIEVDGIKSLPVDIEVRSKKVGYAKEYADMMADLSEDCSALIYELRSPVHQPFDISGVDRKTLYEDFLFLEYLFKDENLPAAYNRIKEAPKTQLEKEKELVPIGLVQSMETEDLLDIVCMPQFLVKTVNPPQNWPAAMKNYVPLEVWETTFVETLDIPENRFVKYFLELVYDIILKLQEADKLEGYIKDRLQFFHDQITDSLSDEWLKEVGQLSSIPMNSQLLQKREGYRDVYYFYLNFEFAFRFNWKDIEDSLNASEKRMSQLYEYWCFFRLINALKNVADLKTDGNEVIELLDDGWRIKLKQGKKSKIEFSLLDEKENEHHFELYYNRGFTRRGKPENRSYSLPFRPDYTIVYKTPDNAPTYLHFDAKYRSQKELEDFRFEEKFETGQGISGDFTEGEEKKVNEIKSQETSRKYKNADIYKMHTYKDGILNSLGAYVLYPGEKKGLFREYDDYLVPSIGAIPLKPDSDYKVFYDKIDKILKGLFKDNDDKLVKIGGQATVII